MTMLVVAAGLNVSQMSSVILSMVLNGRLEQLSMFGTPECMPTFKGARLWL